MFFRMSIPGDQPNPYAQQPQQPAQAAQPTQAGQPYQAARPYQPGQPQQQPQQGGNQPGGGQQHESPYASYGQPTTSGYGHGQSQSHGQSQQQPLAGSGVPVGVSGLAISGSPPGGTPPPDKPRSRIPGWVWGVGGVVITSAVWAAAVITTGGFSEDSDADLGGYHFHKDMCAAVDRSALEKHYDSANEQDSDHYSSQHEALDSSSCSLRFSNDDKPGNYSTTYMEFGTIWHKKTDPTAEFEAKTRFYEDRTSRTTEYAVEAVDGVGEEAYLVISTSKRDNDLDSVFLTARDGWIETRVDWNDLSTGSDSDRLSKDEVREMLVKSANGTLEKLRTKPTESDAPDSSDDSDASDEPEDSTDPGSDNEEDGPPKRGEGDV